MEMRLNSTGSGIWAVTMLLILDDVFTATAGIFMSPHCVQAIRSVTQVPAVIEMTTRTAYRRNQ